jgi:GNAT superfamily N-acetyltransferase
MASCDSTPEGAAPPGAGAPAPVYPHELIEDVLLRDGVRAHLRPIRPDDESRLVDYYSRLSQHTAYHRFFTLMKRLPLDWAHYLANVDYHRRLALVAERLAPEAEPELLAVGRYEATADAVPEVAFVVKDGWQGRGLGTILLDRILRAGVSRGFTTFRAYVLADNVRMLRLLNRQTKVRERRVEDGVVVLLFERR